MTWVCDVYYRYSNSQYNELRDVIRLCFMVLNCCVVGVCFRKQDMSRGKA